MIEEKIVYLLKETLMFIRSVSDEKKGWQTIISLYKEAIEKAEKNKYFSTLDASRVFLEFNSDYSSDVFKSLDRTGNEIERYFRDVLRDYIAGNVGSNRLDSKIEELARHSDIYEEFINYILAGETFDETSAIVVEGYTAKQLTNETFLTPLGAFNFLVYLKEEPQEALADLKAKLPHRKILNKIDLQEVEKLMEETKQLENEVVEQVAENVAPAPSDDNVILEKLDALQQAIQGLQECFDAKIAEDTHKNGLFDNMHKELTRYQNGAMDKLIDTLALDIIQLVDTTKGHVRVYEKKEPTEENYKRLLRIVKGISEDLQDILYRQNIESYRVEGHEVDVRRQKIIQTVPTDDKAKDNLVAVRAADGYEKNGKVLRAERIKIFKYTTETTGDSAEN